MFTKENDERLSKTTYNKIKLSRKDRLSIDKSKVLCPSVA